MAKPDTGTLPSHVQDAAAMFNDVVAQHVANNPKLAMEEKMANLVESANLHALKGVQVKSAGDLGDFAAPPMNDESKLHQMEQHKNGRDGR